MADKSVKEQLDEERKLNERLKQQADTARTAHAQAAAKRISEFNVANIPGIRDSFQQEAYTAFAPLADTPLPENAKAWSHQSRFLGAEHQQMLRQLQIASTLPIDEAQAVLSSFEDRWQALSPDKVADLQKTDQGKRVLSMYQSQRSRAMSEISIRREQLKRNQVTDFRRSVETSASPVSIDETGAMRVRSTSDMITDLTNKQEETRQKFVGATSPLMKSIAEENLVTVGERLRRTQIAQTREASAAIAGQTQFMPTETAPGVWTNPMLATQRAATDKALQAAKAQLATLGQDALPEQQKAANELLKKMVDQLSRIDSTIKQGQQELQKTQAQSPFMSRITPRMDGEEDADYAKRIAERSAKWRGIGGGVVSGLTTATQVTAAFQQMTMDMPRRTLSAAAGIEGGMQSQILDSFGFGAAARVKFGGDVLYGDRTLGRSGYDRANQLASEEIARRRRAEGTSALGQGLMSLAGVGLTAGGAVASATGLGAAIGIPMAAAGLGMLGVGATNVMSNTRLQESGIMGQTVKQYADATRVGQFQSAQQDVLNSAMQMNRINIAKQEALEGGLAVYGQNIRMAGAWAVDPASLLAKQGQGVDEGALATARARSHANYMQSLKPQTASGLGATGPEYTAFGPRIGQKSDTGGTVQDGLNAAAVFAESVERQKQTADSLKTGTIANRDKFFARYGVTAEEWSTRISGVAANVMGTGLGARGGAETAAQNLYGMGMAGVGSFEQLSGNSAALANITGRTDATGDLKRVLSEAVKAGFDNSRTGQMFVQSTMSLANSMGIRSTEGISRQLGMGSRLLGGTEKDMEMMARGMSGMANIMDTNRTLGGLNFAAFAVGGGLDLQGPLAQDAFDAGKNPQRALKIQADQRKIEAWKNKNAKIGPDGKILNESDLMYKMLDQQEFKDIDPAMRNALVMEGFGGTRKFSQAAMSSMNVVQAFSGQREKITGLMDRIRSGKVKGPEARHELEQLVTSGQAGFGRSNVDEATRRALSVSGLTEIMGDEGSDLLRKIGIKDLGSFAGQQSKGEAAAQQAAMFQREQVAAKAALLAGDQGLRKDLRQSNLSDLARGGKIKFLSPDAKESEISLERAKQIQKSGPGTKFADPTERAFSEFLDKNSKASAAMQQQMLTTLEAVASGKVQEVVVKNWEGMIMAQREFGELAAPGKK